MLRPFGTALAPVLLLGCLACASAPADPAPAAELEIHGTFAIYFLGGVQHGLWQL
jgi:hypothetical protein